MPSFHLMMKMIGSLLRAMLTGYVEPPRPTSPERTEARRQNLAEACQRLLETLVGPGDLLDSETRSEFAKEAYAAVNSCYGGIPCLQNGTKFVTFNKMSVTHTYVSHSPYRDVAHAIVNNQDKLDEVFFDTFVQQIQEDYSDKTNDDCMAIAVEFAIIASCCAAVHDFYVGAGMKVPPLPPCTPQKAYFDHVSDYSSVPLQVDKPAVWGPYLSETQIKPEFVNQHNFDPSLHQLGPVDHKSPTSKVSAAPVTSYAWFQFMSDTYVDSDNIVSFFSVPGKDRHLNRAQVEVVAAVFNRAKLCRF